MSAPKQSPFPISLSQIITGALTALLVSALVGALSVYVTATRTSDRLVTVEQKIDTNKTETDAQFKELRDHTITRAEFQSFKEAMQDVRADIREIRNAQMQEQRRR
ncbi:MAG TPA: hypothetical protein VGB17_15580 [Pyrinomonadaceae bacterium]